MIADLNIWGRTARQLVLVDYAYVVDDALDERFMVSLQPTSRGRSSDESPRASGAYIMRWRAGLLGPSTVPQAGWRVSCTRPFSSRMYENTLFELLTDPEEIRLGPETAGLQANVLPVGDLYPNDCVLCEQDGEEVEDIVVALWSEREGHRDTGQYEEFRGEAPIEYATSVRPNRYLYLGDERYRIVNSTVDLEGPRVQFEARRSNG